MVQDGSGLSMPIRHFAARRRHSGEDQEVVAVLKKLTKSDFSAIIWIKPRTFLTNHSFGFWVARGRQPWKYKV
jgi:hypothetical protein